MCRLLLTLVTAFLLACLRCCEGKYRRKEAVLQVEHEKTDCSSVTEKKKDVEGSLTADQVLVSHCKCEDIPEDDCAGGELIPQKGSEPAVKGRLFSRDRMDRQIRCLPSGGSCKTATRGMECSLATDERPRAVFWYESGSSDPSEGICAASEQHDRRRLLPVERCEDIPLYAELQGFGMSEEAMASRCNKFAIFTGFEVVKGSEADEDPPQKRVVAIPCALSPGARRWRSASVSPLSFCSPASPVKECRLAVRGSCSAFVELRRCAWSLHNDTTAGGQSEEGGQASGCEWRECKEPSGRIEPKIRSASCETGPLINNLDTTGAQILPVRETM